MKSLKQEGFGKKSGIEKKLVIFPMDGVVVETNLAFWPAVKDLLKANGISEGVVDEKLVNFITGMSHDEMVGNLRELFDIKTSRRDLIGQFSEFFCKRLEQEAFAVNGFDSFRDQLVKAGYTVAVRTGTPNSQVAILDKKFDFTHNFGPLFYTADNAEKHGYKLSCYIARDLGLTADDYVVIVKRPEDQKELIKNNIKSIAVDYKKSIDKNGLVVATLKPFDQVLKEIKEILPIRSSKA